MKKKIPYILLIITLIASAAIVINGIVKNKNEKAENTEYAESVAKNSSFADTDSESVYEYYQTDPESGLAVIYTFTVYPEKDGSRNGTISVQGAGNDILIRCAVKIRDKETSLLFAEHLNGKAGDFSAGDELVTLHKTDKDVVAEFSMLKKVYPGEDFVRNY